VHGDGEPYEKGDLKGERELHGGELDEEREVHEGKLGEREAHGERRLREERDLHGVEEV
jgi:hypothetical protein